MLLIIIIYCKHWKKRPEEPGSDNNNHIYVSVPPQLPASRLTNQENPAYEKVDCVAHSSEQSQEIEIKEGYM